MMIRKEWSMSTELTKDVLLALFLENNTIMIGAFLVKVRLEL